MDVILLERIEKLGQMGDRVRVKDGYARNCLLPGGKALRATAANRERFERERAQLEADNLERRGEAETIAARMAGLTVAAIRQAGESGQLYGSVNARDVARAVTEAGFTVARAQVALVRPIKTIGLHDARIVLHPEVAAQIRVNVARSHEEAREQAGEPPPEESGEYTEAAPFIGDAPQPDIGGPFIGDGPQPETGPPIDPDSPQPDVGPQPDAGPQPDVGWPPAGGGPQPETGPPIDADSPQPDIGAPPGGKA